MKSSVNYNTGRKSGGNYMKPSTITKTLGLLAMLGSSVSIATSVTVTANTLTPTLIPNVDVFFTLTITGDVPNTVSGTMDLSFDNSKVAFVSGAALAPWTVFTKNSLDTANPTVFDVETPSPTAATPGVYNIALLTFKALAGGSAGIVINDDGGNTTGFFEANTTANYIPVTYTQANVVVQPAAVPVPATLGLLASGLAGLVLRGAHRKRAA